MEFELDELPSILEHTFDGAFGLTIFVGVMVVKESAVPDDSERHQSFELNGETYYIVSAGFTEEQEAEEFCSLHDFEAWDAIRCHGI